MSLEHTFGLQPDAKQKVAKMDAKVRKFISRCLVEGDTAVTLAPALLAAGCDMLETATGNHDKAVLALKAMTFMFSQAHKTKPH
jgi:hypothetical protein